MSAVVLVGHMFRLDCDGRACASQQYRRGACVLKSSCVSGIPAEVTPSTKVLGSRPMLARVFCDVTASAWGRGRLIKDD